MKVFGCRHCGPKSPEPAKDPTSVRPTQNSDGNREKRFTFDGLICHAKEKYGTKFLLPWTYMLNEHYSILGTRYFLWMMKTFFVTTMQLMRK
jgi:hypothetical protein